MSALPNNLLPLTDGAIAIGLTKTALYGKGNTKYRPFIHNVDGRLMFDINGYKSREESLHELKERVRQFVEYLVHEEGVSYTRIAKNVRESVALISSLEFGAEVALNIARWYKARDKFTIVRFDKYYGWVK